MHHHLSPGRRHVQRLSRGRSSLSPVLSVSADPLAASPFGEENLLRTNPLLPAPSQDPQITWIGGRYYYCESTAQGIFLRVADDFLDLDKSPMIRIWAPARRGPAAKNIWAPELHVIGDRCYVYFAADNGDNAQHRMWVLASETADPLGRYTLHGPLQTGGWAIDGTILTGRSGELYFVWSGWPGRVDGQQNLYLTPMANPLEIGGPRVLLSRPTESWERRGMPICEGPQVLKRGGKTFIVYAASASWTADYCLGMLVNETGDYLNPRAWSKVGQVFGANEHAWGVGHCGFLSTPEGEDWIFYHAKTLRRPGWNDREVRAQVFSWSPEGRPIFGAPVDRKRPLLRALANLPKAS